MKKLKIIFLLAGIIFFISKSEAQDWGINGNSISSNEWLGALNTSTIPLRIKTEDALDINFYTNAGAGTFLNQRMTILSGGNVGIGTAAPNYRLHLHTATTGTEVFEQFTNGTTLSTPTDCFRIGVNSANNAELRMYESAPMTFFTNNNERMRIIAGGDVGIGITTSARRLDVASAAYQLRLTFNGIKNESAALLLTSFYFMVGNLINHFNFYNSLLF